MRDYEDICERTVGAVSIGYQVITFIEVRDFRSKTCTVEILFLRFCSDLAVLYS